MMLWWHARLIDEPTQIMVHDFLAADACLLHCQKLCISGCFPWVLHTKNTQA